MTADHATAGRVAWFNCQAGVAGDMTMAALVDAGAAPDDVADAIAGLGVDGYALTFERVQRCGVGATWANVIVHDIDDGHDIHEVHAHDHTPHRPVREILDLLDRADLTERVRARARSVFIRLAEVEGAIHGHDPMDVELHEVGALDSIIDVVGACAALESLGIDEVFCSAIAVGSGTIRSAHGLIPNPAPATVALLTERRVPTVGLDVTLEVATPTGVALMATLATAFGSPPAMTPDAVGYGAGTADPPERANVVQVLVGERTGAAPSEGTPVTLLECNVDDVTGEVLANTVATVMAAGAHDAWVTPIVMKKGRPAHTVHVLAAPDRAADCERIVLAETGSLGVRRSPVERAALPRRSSVVEVAGHPVRVKHGPWGSKPEHDDVAAAATALGLPLREVARRAMAAVDDGDGRPELQRPGDVADPLG